MRRRPLMKYPSLPSVARAGKPKGGERGTRDLRHLHQQPFGSSRFILVARIN